MYRESVEDKRMAMNAPPTPVEERILSNQLRRVLNTWYPLGESYQDSPLGSSIT
jgi:hypothetical protein